MRRVLSSIAATTLLAGASCGPGRTEPLGIPESDFADCAGLDDEQSCNAQDGCIALICPSCDGPPSFSTCYPTGGKIGCPEILCAPPACVELDFEGCARAADRCHPVYGEANPACNCDAIGCCVPFLSCGEGARPDCGEANCRSAPPNCDTGFTPSIAGGCWEGCVPEEACVERG